MSYPTIASDRDPTWPGPTMPPAPPPLVWDPGAADQQRADDVAKNLCRGKNRNFRTLRLTMPFNPTIESGTVYQLKGFATALEGLNALVTEVCHHFRGGSGSTTDVVLQWALGE